MQKKSTKNNWSLLLLIVVTSLLLSACVVGPNYVRPCVVVPTDFKEGAIHWKLAKPNDEQDRGAWWKIFHDPQLDALEHGVNISNQSIAQALGQYCQARALVGEARAAYFPTITASGGFTRQGIPSTVAVTTPGGTTSSSTSSSGGINTNATAGSSTRKVFNSYSLSVTATWEPDIWGAVQRMVEAAKAGAQASAAELAAVRLSSQALLAEDYFQLRALDSAQVLLDNTVVAYQKTLKLTRQQFTAGIASLADIASAEALLETARAQAINNGISRAQFEHAIAVLIGQPASLFSIPCEPLNVTPPPIPVEVPSTLLERRPDIAQQERLVAQANANIGVAIAAYFPTVTLSGNGGFNTTVFPKLLTKPSLLWSFGPQVTETIYDGGLRYYQVLAARATYSAAVAGYRQTVLAAFQNVEDNLAALRLLASEAKVQDLAVAAAKTSLKLTIADYKAGTTNYLNVMTAEVTAYTAEQTAASIAGQRMVAAVGLIAALGGGWDACTLAGAGGP